AAENPSPPVWTRKARAMVESAQSRSATSTVQRLIEQGETAGIEYKTSLRADQETGTVKKELTRAVVTTVAAFMNGEGGTLLIGVEDDGSVVGIESDLRTLRKQDVDGFELS